MFCKIYLLLTVLLTLGRADDFVEDNVMENAFKISRLVADKCWSRAVESYRDNLMFGIEQCLKRTSLIVLDRFLRQDLIELPCGIKLIRSMHEINQTTNLDRRSILYDSNKVINWNELVLDKIGSFFETHLLKIHMDGDQKFEGRRRRNRDQMMPIILFGVMAMAIIAIPMGFQFLAVLGGKALLLAKLALILTSIQGLKRIAQSDMAYGLYRAPTPHHQSKPWLYDRRWQFSGAEGQNVDDYESQASEHHSHPLDLIRPRISVLQHD